MADFPDARHLHLVAPASRHGEQPYWMAITLAAMLGQIGLRGGGFGFGYGNSDGIGSTRLPSPPRPSRGH